MSSKDYLTRYFQQLGEVIAAVAGFREKKKYALALDEINQVMHTWFNISESDLDEYSANEFCNLLFQLPSANFEKEKSIAELLFQKAITFHGMNKRESSIESAKKSIALYKSIDLKSGSFSIEIQHRIVELDKLLSGAYLA
ncbi:MAG: hypothetical protein PF541_11485 [Prolixibacteraceae bacterium]|jgi:hypothetical protein|nr:hypothetical protein [Prolixibacteraceae bacterium]